MNGRKKYRFNILFIDDVAGFCASAPIEQAKEACVNSRQRATDLFENILEMITTDKSVPSLRFATPYCRS
jgi:hypothetical protein